MNVSSNFRVDEHDVHVLKHGHHNFLFLCQRLLSGRRKLEELKSGQYLFGWIDFWVETRTNWQLAWIGGGGRKVPCSHANYSKV